MINIENITFRIAGRVLFEEAGCFIAKGQHIGLIGKNGSGKTTLFKLINGFYQLDAGGITIAKEAALGLLPQEPPMSEKSVLDYVVTSDSKREKLLAELKHLKEGCFDLVSHQAQANGFLQSIELPHLKN